MSVVTKESAIIVQSPAVHQVFQRNDDSLANVVVDLSTHVRVEGTVEYRLDEDAAWLPIGSMSAGRFSGQIDGVPCGQHALMLRIVTQNGQIISAPTVDPFFVGDLWILAGQSNMEGCGKLTDVDEPAIGVSCFYMGDTWDIATEPLCWLNESLDPVNWTVPPEDRDREIRLNRQNRVQGAGLGLAFAKEVMKRTGVPIGLIMCAHGGTSMQQWDPELVNEGGKSLYGAMIRKVRKLGGRVAGCLWYQGESDANADDAAVYIERMQRWIASLRRDTGDARLPFIYAQLSIFYVWDENAAGWDRIQHEQLRLESLVDRVAVVPTIDAQMSDAIHLDGPSLRLVGQRMAWRALELSYGQTVAKSGPRPGTIAWNTDRTRLTVRLSGVNGSLVPVSKVNGFQVALDGKGVSHQAEVGPDGCSVVLRFESSVPEGSQLWHAPGFNPTVNVQDQRGVPLVAFGPVSV